MSTITLPASSYAEALPYLRAPFTPSVIRFRIQTVPDDSNQPCVVVLYVTSETIMDRFNIVCGDQWTPPEFTVLAHRQEEKTHHVKSRATFTVFGREFADKSEASGESEVQAEFNANARAFKRAARWPGPGQSLYQPCTIKMFRGVGEQKLRMWGNNLKKPHIDDESERFLLAHYGKVLAEKIIPIYGEPFDHLAAISGRMTVLVPAPSADGPRTPTLTAAQPPPDASQPASSSDARRPRRSASNASPSAIREAASGVGYTDGLTEALMTLVRDEEAGGLSVALAECVEQWVRVLGDRKVPEAKILEAVTFAIDNCATLPGAQVKFGQWVAAKASAAPAAAPKTGTPATNGAIANGSAPQPPSTSDARPGSGESPQVQLDAAMAQLTAAIACHEYTERTAARIAALAIGADPDAKIALEKIAPATLRLVGELLDAAATLEWSTGKLDEEISRAHNNTQQGTSASRFGAFAVHLVNSAEARIDEANRAAEAAAATV